MLLTLIALAALIFAILAFFPVRHALNVAVLLLAILAAWPILGRLFG